MTDEEAWSAEEDFWLGSAEDNAARLSAHCLMVFAQMGIMAAEAVAASLREAPRWARVTIADGRLTRPDADLIVLAYRAEASREGAEPYHALCTSVWHRGSGGWLIVQHQQTAAP